MRVVLIGPPGSGKGTQAKRLADRLGLVVIGTGEVLRDAMRRRTPLGVRIEPLMREGRFAPDELVNGVVAEFFAGPRSPERFVLDGYPRTAAQAAFLDGLLRERSLPLSAVVHLVIDDLAIMQRIAGRLSCPGCGATYHPTASPPRTPGVCDGCGSRLSTRDDDDDGLARARLASYQTNADGLLAYYRSAGRLINVDATGPADDVFRRLLATVSHPYEEGPR
jgi:adenylate kinase